MPFSSCSRSESLGDDGFAPDVFELMMQDLRQIGFDLRPALKALAIPTFVIQGAEDPIGTASEVAAALAGSPLHLVERTGHYPWFERPDAFYPPILDFLDTVDSR